MNGRSGGVARQDRPDAPPARRLAELEAENAALRRALAEAGLGAERTADRHGAERSREQAGRSADAAEARSAAARAGARHGRGMAAGRSDLAAAEEANETLRRANVDLAASRASLRGSEERLRLILASATDYAIIGMDLDRRVTSWNAGAERLLGWGEDEIVGRPADLIFTPEDRAGKAPEREAAGALREGRATNERWHVRKDGTRFWGSGLMMPLRDQEAGPGAPPLGLLKVMRDDTRRVLAEAALREAEDHLRHTVELSPQIPWTAGPDGRITGFGGRWLEVTGLSREAAMGEGWKEVPHPKDREAMAAAWARAVSTGEPYEAEARLRMADGSHRWWRARATPRLDAEGRVVRWYGTTEDIHDRKAAEERLREGEARWRGLFERMREGFALVEMVHGPDGRAVDYRFLAVNDAWVRHIGIPRSEAVGRLVSEILPGGEHAFWVEVHARVDETGEPEHVERYAPTIRRWVSVVAYRAERGRVAALVTDVTERKAAEARKAALLELGDRLRDLRDPAEIAHAAAEVIGRALGAARAGYGTVDGEGTLRVDRDWTGGSAASVAGAHRLSDYWTGFADDLRRGEVVAIADAARDPRTAPRHAASYAALGIGAALHVPVVERGRVAAILYVHEAAPRDWSAEEVAFVRGAADRAWAAAERARAEGLRALLIAELNHRVKNTLAVVQSLALQTARGTPDPSSFPAAFQARLIALARAHDLLTRGHWEGASLCGVVRAALGVDAGAGAAARVDFSACAPDAVLAPPQALALAMALHELATNALKHGALSLPEGRVSVACGADPRDGSHLLEWVERGGPPVAGPPARRGFGLRLLERGLAAQAGVSAELRFEPGGVRCALRLPPLTVGTPPKWT